MKHANELLKFWGINQFPFGPIEDGSRIFVPASWQMNLDRLVLACERHSQLITIFSEAGHAKTSLSKWLYQQIDTHTQEVFLIPVLQQESEHWLLRRLAKLLQIDLAEHSNALEATIAGLEELKDEQRGLCVIIDDAHVINTDQGLHELHILLGLASALHININIVVFGLPVLYQSLKAHPNLQARIALQLELNPLSLEEASDYVRKSLLNAHLDPKIFNLDAIRAIYQESGGYFLRMNQIMENLLCEGFIRRQKRINRELIEATARLLPRRRDSVDPSHSPQSSQNSTEGPAAESQPVMPRGPENNSSISLSSLFYRNDDESQSEAGDSILHRNDSAG